MIIQSAIPIFDSQLMLEIFILIANDELMAEYWKQWRLSKSGGNTTKQLRDEKTQKPHTGPCKRTKPHAGPGKLARY